jgi:hypothetical protein
MVDERTMRFVEECERQARKDAQTERWADVDLAPPPTPEPVPEPPRARDVQDEIDADEAIARSELREHYL